MVGLALAPIIGGYIFGVLYLAIGSIIQARNPSVLEPLLISFIFAVLGVIFLAPLMYMGIFIVGIPAILILHWAHFERWWTYATFGAAGAALIIPPFKGSGTIAAASNSVAGAIILTAFWLISRRGQQNLR
jgi:hypothetical protein